MASKRVSKLPRAISMNWDLFLPFGGTLPPAVIRTLKSAQTKILDFRWFQLFTMILQRNNFLKQDFFYPKIFFSQKSKNISSLEKYGPHEGS